jgi:hypothetical protein
MVDKHYFHQVQKSSSKEKWLVVGWPGVCGVASQVVQKLDQGFGAETNSFCDSSQEFSLDEIIVKNGVAFPGKVPNLIFRHAPLGGSHDLLLFQPERQPETNGLEMCRGVMKAAIALGVRKVISFAAQPSTVDPRSIPRVKFCSSDPEFGTELSARKIEPLEDGKIRGLNGLILIAAQEHGIPAACLIGEVPTLGLQMLNPKTMKVLLSAFLELSGTKLDLSHMDETIQVYEEYMLELADSIEGSFLSVDPTTNPELLRGQQSEFDEAKLEELFQDAGVDRVNAMYLKSELDRLDLYTQYEDRFLDLFRDCS